MWVDQQVNYKKAFNLNAFFMDLSLFLLYFKPKKVLKKVNHYGKLFKRTFYFVYLSISVKQIILKIFFNKI